MGKKSDPPPGPDWNKLLAMSSKYQAENSALQREYMDLVKGTVADQKAIQDDILDIQLPAMRDEAELAQIQRDRYRDQGLPFENDYLEKISSWDTPERRETEAGRAQTDIAVAADAARDAAKRNMARLGIGEDQIASQALDRSLGLQEAIAKAGAGNNARRQIEKEGIALGGEAVNLYRGMPAMAGASLANATGAGNAAMGATAQRAQTAQGGYGTGSNMMTQGFNMGNSAYSTAGQLHGNELAAWEMQQKYSPMQTLGNLAGAAMGGWASGGFNAEGGPVPHRAEGGPAQSPQKPMAAPRPPSQGIPPENQTITVSPGEYIVPDDVVRWLGEKQMQSTVNKAREERQATEQQRNQNQRALGIPA